VPNYLIPPPTPLLKLIKIKRREKVVHGTNKKKRKELKWFSIQLKISRQRIEVDEKVEENGYAERERDEFNIETMKSKN